MLEYVWAANQVLGIAGWIRAATLTVQRRADAARGKGPVEIKDITQAQTELPEKLAEMQRTRVRIEAERDRLAQGIVELEKAQARDENVPGLDVPGTLAMKRGRMDAIERGLALLDQERRTLAQVQRLLEEARGAGIDLNEPLALNNGGRLEQQLIALRTETDVVHQDALAWRWRW